jgi:O-antigen/teichoic acid export membrane protein
MSRLSFLLRQSAPAKRRICKLFRTALVSIVTANAGVIILTTGTGIVSARLLGPEGRGQLAAMTLWPHFLGGLFAAGLPAALTYNLKRRPEEASTLFAGALTCAVTVGAIGALIGIPIVWLSLPGYPLGLKLFAVGALIFTPVEVVAQVLQSGSLASDRYDVYSRVRVSVPFLILSLLLLWRPSTPLDVALVSIGGGLPVFLAQLAQAWRQFRPSFLHMRTSLLELVAYARGAAAIDFLTAASLQLDRVIVVSLLPPTLAGLYIVAVSAASPLATFRNAVASLVLPRASPMTTHDAAHFTLVASMLTLAATAFSGLVLLGLAPVLLSMLYGSEFVVAVPTLRLLILEATCAGFCTVLCQAFIATKRPGPMVFGQIIWTVTLLVSMPIAALRLDAEGAAISILAATILRSGYVISVFVSTFPGLDVNASTSMHRLRQLLT